MIGVMRQPSEVAARIPRGHVERLQWEDLGAQRGGHVPADDAARVDVGDESDVGEPAPGFDVGDVANLEPLGRRCRDATVDEIARQRSRLVGSGRQYPLGLLNASHAGEVHDALGLVSADFPSLPA